MIAYLSLSCHRWGKKCHIGHIKSFREWKCIQKRDRRWETGKKKKGIETTREKNRNSLLMPKETQREYEGVKPDNIVKRPGQSTKAISSRAPNHSWRRKWNVTENWEFRDGMIIYLISFLFNQGHALLGLRGNKKLWSDAKPSTLQMSGAKKYKAGWIGQDASDSFKLVWQVEQDRMMRLDAKWSIRPLVLSQLI